MDLELAGKSAFVSGSSSGIGSAIALGLAAEGCNVVIHGRDADRCSTVAQQCEAAGVKAAVALGDLSNDAGADAACDAALTAFPGIDILVNNCGRVLRYDNPAWDELTTEDYINSMNVNVIAGVRLARRFAPHMRTQKWGRIINISSISGLHVDGGLVDYSIAKAALNKLSADMSKSLGPQGITVNTIVPGTTLTPAMEDYLAAFGKTHGCASREETEGKSIEQNPQSVPRLGQPKDVAALAAFLASPLSGTINGALYRIDGGHARYV